MSKITFRPVSPLLAALNAAADLRYALLMNGPVLIGVLSVEDITPAGSLLIDYTVVTNFRDENAMFLDKPIVIDGVTVGYEAYSHSSEEAAQQFAWDLYLNMTHTQFDIQCRRKVRKATELAVEKKRLFSDLGVDYFDHNAHPTTLDDDVWFHKTVRRLDDNLMAERFMTKTYPQVSLLPQWVRDEIVAIVDDMYDQRAALLDHDVVLDAEPDYPHGEDAYPENLSGNLPNITDNGEFPDHDDPEYGLEVRLSRDYEVHHGIAA